MSTTKLTQKGEDRPRTSKSQQGPQISTSWKPARKQQAWLTKHPAAPKPILKTQKRTSSQRRWTEQEQTERESHRSRQVKRVHWPKQLILGASEPVPRSRPPLTHQQNGTRRTSRSTMRKEPLNNWSCQTTASGSTEIGTKGSNTGAGKS